MNIQELIRARRSVMPDQYIDRQISVDCIKQILEAANWAPTHKKTEPWRFKIISGDVRERFGKFLAEKYREDVDKFSEFKYNKLRDNPKKASVIIAICMQRNQQDIVPEWEEIAAVAMAVQNMWLVATSLNIGAYWSSPALIHRIDAFLKLSEGEKCLGFFYMGYYETKSPDRIPGAIADKIEWL
jgi:nitroreductase